MYQAKLGQNTILSKLEVYLDADSLFGCFSDHHDPKKHISL